MHHDGYLSFWGKSHPLHSAPYPQYHPLSYHCLDVASVCHVYLEQHPFFLSTLTAKVLGEENVDPNKEEMIKRWVVLLVCWHDLGKFSESFQALQPELRASLGHDRDEVIYGIRHDLFPAHAGMNRQMGHVIQLPHTVPRPRGDEPT